jgi:hypothetical protein
MYWVMYDPDNGGVDSFDYIYESASLPEAICRAALLTVGVDK